MNEDNTFTILADNGAEIECETLFTYEDEVTGKNFIVFTDHALDENGNTKVYANIFDPEDDNPVLFPIEDESEWTKIETILESLTKDEE